MKRKRQQQQKRGNALEDEVRDYYDRLLHKCRKDVNKQVKIVRNFECQKLARKLKESSSQQSNSSNNTLSQRLERLKKLPLEVVVEETLRRLGILQIQPPPLSPPIMQHDATTANEDGVATTQQAIATTKETTTTTATATTISEEAKEFMEKILKHKRLQDTIEKWSSQVVEFRQWQVRQEEKQRVKESGGKHTNNNDSKKKKKNDKGDSAATLNSSKVTDDDYSKSIFLKLGNQPDDDDNDNDSQDQEDEDGDDDVVDNIINPNSKKNRPGQRARKAKAMAVKAKKEGRKWDSSMNWRPKKATAESEQDDHSSNINNQRSNQHGHGHDSSSHNMPKGSAAAAATTTSSQANVAAAEELHPSWAARKAQSTGISQFQGKKITFD